MRDRALLKVFVSDDWSLVISLDSVLVNLFPCLAELISFGGKADWIILLMVVKRVVLAAILSDSVQMSVVANPKFFVFSCQRSYNLSSFARSVVIGSAMV